MITTLQTFRSLPRIVTRGVLSVFWGVESNILDLGNPQVSLHWPAYIQVVLKSGAQEWLLNAWSCATHSLTRISAKASCPSNSTIRLVPRACEGK